MFESQKAIIITALQGIADRVCESFDEMNMLHHINETLGFVGLNEYRCATPSGDGKRSFDTTFEISLLGKRSMTASELCIIADNSLVPKLYECPTAAEVIRQECVYSKEHQRYLLTVVVKFKSEYDCAYSPDFTVTFSDEDWSIFDECEIANEYKMYELTTVTGGNLHGIKASRPLSVTLKAHGSVGGILKKYALASPLKGSYKVVSIDGTLLGVLMVGGVYCDISDGKARLTIKLDEVNA